MPHCTSVSILMYASVNTTPIKLIEQFLFRKTSKRYLMIFNKWIKVNIFDIQNKEHSLFVWEYGTSKSVGLNS